ncbi:MAG TPA: VC0807 family protein [Aquihabitans sp.]|nr:VC0807 family protein [Aquihabitans sp.]
MTDEELADDVARTFLDDDDVAGPAADHAEEPAAEVASVLTASVSVRGILLGSGPRFARDAFGPVLGFYVGWKLVGLAVGMAVAVVVAVAAYAYERRQSRPGVMARVALGIIAIQVAIGAIADDAKAFLAPPVLINGAYGLVFLGSVALRRPLAGVFAGELHEFPDEVRRSATFRSVFSRVSLVWGAYLVVRSLARFWVLTQAGVDAFVVFNLVTGFPLMSLLLSWSVWYGVRSFRRSAEWGWAFETDPAAVAAAPADGAGPA